MSSASVISEQDFVDWPLDNIRSMKTVVRDLRRANKTFMSSHNDWAKNSGIRSSDRAVHEHRTLSKVLDLLQWYDQLNMPNCVAAEVALKRRMLLEDAYDGRPEAPQFEGTDHFMGHKDSESGKFVDKEAVRYRANMLKEESVVLREMRLKKEEDGHMRGGPPNKSAAGGGNKAPPAGK